MEDKCSGRTGTNNARVPPARHPSPLYRRPHDGALLLLALCGCPVSASSHALHHPKRRSKHLHEQELCMSKRLSQGWLPEVASWHPGRGALAHLVAGLLAAFVGLSKLFFWPPGALTSLREASGGLLHAPLLPSTIDALFAAFSLPLSLLGTVLSLPWARRWPQRPAAARPPRWERGGRLP